MNYNYHDAIITDIREYINENFTAEELTEKLQDREAWQEELYNDLWCCDSVTGNASGSYTISTYKAEEYIAHNLDLLSEALQEFGCDVNVLEKGAEWCDVTIRCYLLYGAVDTVLDDLEA